MIPENRTQDVFEYIEGYPKPPLIPVPDIHQFEVWQQSGFKDSWFSRLLIKSVVLLTGFGSYSRHLSQNLEDILRKFNGRLPGLFSPLISATLVIKDDPKCSSPTARAASLIFAARSLYRDLHCGKFEPDRYKNSTLEMGQYPNLFSTCLSVKKKGVKMFKSKDTSRINLAITRKFYSLEIGGIESKIKFNMLKSTLDYLVNKAEKNRLKQSEPPVGILTCASDKVQIKAFQNLKKMPINQQSFHQIQNGFLTICFDLDNFPDSDEEAALLAHSGNYANRWQHSSLQFVIFGNAKVAVICNFTTYIDGNVMMRSASEMQKRAAYISMERKKHDEMPSDSLYPSVELKWRINRKFIRMARLDLQKIQDNQKATFTISGIGRDFFESHKMAVTPSFILALELAVKKVTGQLINISQFLTMAKYRCMDLLETVTTTPEVKKFVDYIDSPEVDPDTAKNLLIEANESQFQKYRKKRSYLPIINMLAMFLNSRKRFQYHYVSMFIFIVFRFLRLCGLYSPERRENIISHPEIYPEVTIVGRPGIKIPYAKYFGLHYQIFSEKIVITMMPGMRWLIPNAEFISVLKESLQQICEIIQDQNKDVEKERK